MKIKDLESYVPESHGEHGVDAILHALSKEGNDFHECACEPPGGSWNGVDIIHPLQERIFIWDNLPRNPPSSVKKPDLIIQWNNGEEINFLMIESKQRQSSLKSNIGTQMVEFMEGNKEFIGLSERPAWHRETENGFEVVEAQDEDRYWLNEYENIKVWSGFAFSGSDGPESEEELDEVLENSDVDLGLTVSWRGDSEKPQMLLKTNKEFNNSEVWSALQQTLKDHNLDTETL